MDPKEKKRKRVERYTIIVELIRKSKQRSGKIIARGEGRGVKPRMRRKETTRGGCAGDSSMPERSTEGERSSKIHDIRSRVSSEDNRSRVGEDEVRSPWFLRDVVTSKEDEAQSINVDVVEDGDGSIQEREEDLAILNGFMWLHVGICFGLLTEVNKRRGRNPLFEQPPLRIYNQEERSEESTKIGVEEERVEDRRREDRSEEEVKFNNTSQ